MSLLVVKQTDYDTPPKNSPSSGGAFGGVRMVTNPNPNLKYKSHFAQIIQSLSFMKLLSESQISILRLETPLTYLFNITSLDAIY